MMIVPIAFFALLTIGLPIGYVIGVAGVIGILGMGPRFLAMAPERMFAGLDLFPFLAMPFFILCGRDHELHAPLDLGEVLAPEGVSLFGGAHGGSP